MTCSSRPFLFALPIGFLLTLRFVDEFLAVRALGILALLAAERRMVSRTSSMAGEAPSGENHSDRRASSTVGHRAGGSG